jgi:hypothetical protein
MSHPAVRLLSSALILALLILGAPAVRAELSADHRANDRTDVFVASIGEDADPIGARVWDGFRDLPPDWILNAEGSERGDGRPDVAFLPNGWPVVVWAYNNGLDHDIALSQWTGNGWSPTEFLTSSIENDLDPRIFIERNGTIHVTWWAQGLVAADRVMLLSRVNDADWNAAAQITPVDTSGWRPAVAVAADGIVRVAYERPSSTPEKVKDMVVAARTPGGELVIELIVPTIRGERLDPVLHVENGQTWVDWKQESTQFGCARMNADGGWTEMTPEPWSEDTWIGVEDVRRTIRRMIVSPAPNADVTTPEP